MSVGSTATRRCPSCRARLGRGSGDGELDDGRCPACGRALDRAGVVLFPLSGDPGTVRAEGEIRTGPTSGRGAWLLVAIVLLVVVALAARSCAPDDPDDAEETASTSTTSTTAAAPTTTDAASASATTEPTFPARVALPEGLLGELAVLTEGGDLYRIDLATGTVRTAPTSIDDVGFSGGPVELAVFGDRTLVAVAERGVLQLVLPDGTTTELEPRPGFGPGNTNIVGAGPAGAVLQSWSSDQPELTLVDPSGALATFPLSALGQVVGVAAGQPVVEVLGRIGRLDPGTGRLVERAAGRALGANDWGLARAVCVSMERCELRSGPWDDLDARAIPLPEALWFESVLDPTGRSLAVLQGSRDGSGPPRRAVIDLTTGAQTDVGDVTSWWQLAFTLDGGHVVVLDDEGLAVVRVADGERLTLPAFPFDVVGFAVG